MNRVAITTPKLNIFLASMLCAAGTWAQSGSLDTSFDPGSGVDLEVYSIGLQTDGRILISGHFSSFNNTARTNVARLNPNGGLDTSFDPGSAVASSFPYVDAVTALSSGEVLVGGSFNTKVSANLARLNTNGPLDTAFTARSDATVNALLVQTNGQIVVGGFFTLVNGAPQSGIARLGAGGVLDTAFNPQLTGGLATIYALALQPDGKILIGGSFNNIDGTGTTNIARLNPDGSLDTLFQPVSVGSLSSAIYSLAIDTQGRVIAGGQFASVNGSVRTNVVRFNSNGSVDGTFNPAAGTDFAVYAVLAQGNNQVLLGGGFNYVNGLQATNVARLNADGSFDGTFNPGGAGPDDIVYAMALQPDGKILIGGAFANYNGTPRSGIARLNNATTPARPQLLNPLRSNSVFRVSVATVNGKNYTLEFKTLITGTNWTSLPAVAGDGTLKILSDPYATNSARFYRVHVQ